MWSKFIQSICGLFNKATGLPANQSGQALPITLAAVALGAMVVGPFLSHASASLIGSHTYAQIMQENYAADAGAAQAIWNLTCGSLAGQIPDQGDQAAYALPSPVNDTIVNLRVTNLYGTVSTPGSITRMTNETNTGGQSGGKVTYEIQARAGDAIVKARLNLAAGVVSALSWQITRANQD